MTAPRNYTELREALQTRMSSLAPGQQRIARVLLTEPESTAFRSISETARAAEVHQSSLVRFANSLGLAGYPDLVQLCRDRLTEQAHLVTRFEQASRHTSAEELLTAVVEHDRDNLTRTFSRIDPAEWERIVARLAQAPRVHVMGLRKCRSVAQLASYLLHMVRRDVHLVTPALGGLVDEVRDLAAGELFLAASIRRYTADTVRAFEVASQRGLHTVALTDDAASPLAAVADDVLLVECEGVTLFRSLTGFTSVVQALATATAIELGTSSRSELLEDEQLLETFGAYEEER
ncbi:MurR/RpiR family transcriptional regulator [Salinifilum aidingensis]